MVLFALINISLDISASISWFVVKNTLYGTYYLGNYLIKGRNPPPPTNEEILLIEINNKLDKLDKIVKKNNENHQENQEDDNNQENQEEDFILIEKNHK